MKRVALILLVAAVSGLVFGSWGYRQGVKSTKIQRIVMLRRDMLPVWVFPGDLVIFISGDNLTRYAYTYPSAAYEITNFVEVP